MGSTAEITFGDLPLLSPIPSSGDFEIDVCVDGTEYGNPEATVAEVASMLMDGARAQITRYGNREATLKVRIKGASLDVVAAGTAAIEMEVNKGRNTLIWLPPGWSTASVFDVVYSDLKFDHDELAEVRVMRHFTLTLVCLPFARRAELTTVIAEPIPSATPTITPIDDCTSLTGWAGVGSSVLVLASGGVRAIKPMSKMWQPAGATRSGLSTTVASSEFVLVDWERPNGLGAWTVVVNGAATSPRAVETISAGSNVREKWYLSVPSGTLNTLTMSCDIAAYVEGQVTIYDISKVDQLPFIGTRRQRMFTADVLGTARTTADLVVETADTALGADVLLYTALSDEALAPPTRQWLVSSASPPASDPTAMSGAWHGFAPSYGVPSVWRIPSQQVPAGAHLIVARLKHTVGTGQINFQWTAGIHGSDYTTSATDVTSTLIPLSLTTSPAFHELGVVTLPPVGLGVGSAAEVEITLGVDLALAEIDDLYLFNIDTGVLTWLTDLDAGAVAPSRIDAISAAADAGRPRWLAGTVGTSADSIDVSERAKSPGVHEFRPGVLMIFVATPDATDQTVTFDAYERHRHHVPPKAS